MEIQIVSGFLGAGKTTFLNQYLPLLEGKTVVIENEFGDIGLDGVLIQEDVPVRELYSGCICCSLAVDFREGIREIADMFRPDQIVIEPSGVGKLSDIVNACVQAKERDGVDLTVTKLITIVDLAGFEEYVEEFGAFYRDQIKTAGLLMLSNLDEVSAKEKERLIEKARQINPRAMIYEADWRKMQQDALLELVHMSADYEEEKRRGLVLPRTENRVFSSVSFQNVKVGSEEELKRILQRLKEECFGRVLRAKGIAACRDGRSLHFDYTPSNVSIEEMDQVNQKEMDGLVIVIGCELQEEAIRTLFLQ